jgi:hypothetical protein
MYMDWIRLADFRIRFDILQIRQRNLGFRVLIVYLSDFVAVL